MRKQPASHTFWLLCYKDDFKYEMATRHLELRTGTHLEERKWDNTTSVFHNLFLAPCDIGCERRQDRIDFCLLVPGQFSLSLSSQFEFNPRAFNCSNMMENIECILILY